MYHSILLPTQDSPPGEDAVLLTAELMQVLADLAPGETPATLTREDTRPLLLRLLQAAMEPLERDQDWRPLGRLLDALDERGAPLLEDLLLPARKEGAAFDPALLPDATVVALAGAINVGGRPGKALALLDSLEGSRPDARFMAMSWQARCHILGADARIDRLWPDVEIISSTGPRALGRRHAGQRRMQQALSAFHAALVQDAPPAARRGLGADLAVMAAWLHGHGQSPLLEGHHGIASHLGDHPAVAREAIDLLMRAPASLAWEPMREDWLEAARRYFLRFLPLGRLPCPPPNDYGVLPPGGVKRPVAGPLACPAAGLSGCRRSAGYP